MEIIFNADNSISVINNEGRVVLKQPLHSFKIENLKQLGFSNDKLNKIAPLIEKRKYSFYS